MLGFDLTWAYTGFSGKSTTSLMSEDTVSLQSFIASGAYIISTPYLAMISEPQKKIMQYIGFIQGYKFGILLYSVSWLVMGFCLYNVFEASLMKVEKYVNLSV